MGQGKCTELLCATRFELLTKTLISDRSDAAHVDDVTQQHAAARPTSGEHFDDFTCEVELGANASIGVFLLPFHGLAVAL